jgi:small subunit ribosomal protein S8
MVTAEDGHAELKPDRDPKAPKRVLRLFLKYGPQGEHVIQHIRRVSSPGCRIYRSYRDIRPVLDGLGVTLVSTSRGVMSDRRARKERLGGEVLCTVW